MDVVREGQQCDSDPIRMDIESLDDVDDELKHELEALVTDAAGRVQNEGDVQCPVTGWRGDTAV